MKNKQKPLIIIPFTLPWDWSADYQRQTCLELQRKGFKVVAYMNDNAHFFTKKNEQKYPKIKNVIFYIPKYYIPFRRIQIIDKLNKYFALIIFNLSIINQLKLIWVFDPQFYYFAKFFNKKVSLYDCVDYHDVPEKNDEDKLIKKSDYLFVNSKSLYKIHKNKKKSLHLVPQGFNIYEFKKKYKKFKKNIENKRPIIGFIGGINYRINYNLLINLAKSNPKWNFSLWGPIQNYKSNDSDNVFKQIKKLKRLENVNFNCTKNKSKLINAINNFDICIIPYDIKQKNNLYSYPMKIFEYFYIGKPVVSTPIKELCLNKFNNLIYIQDSAENFENQIKLLLEKKWPLNKSLKQKQMSLNNSWNNKINIILKKLMNHQLFKK